MARHARDCPLVENPYLVNVGEHAAHAVLFDVVELSTIQYEPFGLTPAGAARALGSEVAKRIERHLSGKCSAWPQRQTGHDGDGI